jgi:hypothetical protein
MVSANYANLREKTKDKGINSGALPGTGLSACIFCRLRRQKDTASIPCAWGYRTGGII